MERSGGGGLWSRLEFPPQPQGVTFRRCHANCDHRESAVPPSFFLPASQLFARHTMRELKFHEKKLLRKVDLLNVCESGANPWTMS